AKRAAEARPRVAALSVSLWPGVSATREREFGPCQCLDYSRHRSAAIWNRRDQPPTTAPDVLENAPRAHSITRSCYDPVMHSRYDLHTLPDGLPVPTDDGLCDHLPGLKLPSIDLNATDGRTVDLAGLLGTTVVYIYPRTGRPDEPGSAAWDAIPGARGCTPQSCGFRDHYSELRALGVSAIFGLSTQTTDYQREAVERLHLPFPLLSDSTLAFTRALRLPTFEFEPYGAEQSTLLKRMALIICDGCIAKVFYPVFPPDRNADDVIAWLKVNAAEV